MMSGAIGDGVRWSKEDEEERGRGRKRTNSNNFSSERNWFGWVKTERL
jgi:hypothetical protein